MSTRVQNKHIRYLNCFEAKQIEQQQQRWRRRFENKWFQVKTCATKWWISACDVIVCIEHSFARSFNISNAKCTRAMGIGYRYYTFLLTLIAPPWRCVCSMCAPRFTSKFFQLKKRETRQHTAEAAAAATETKEVSKCRTNENTCQSMR